MRELALLFTSALLAAASAEDVRTGFQRQAMEYSGPGEWRRSAEPIWVTDAHSLRVRYHATGLPASDMPVLTLRPGAVGPVTPGATNREDRFAMGTPVVVARASDFMSDAVVHVLGIELKGKMLRPQVDQLIFSLPAGARLISRGDSPRQTERPRAIPDHRRASIVDDDELLINFLARLEVMIPGGKRRRLPAEERQ